MKAQRLLVRRTKRKKSVRTLLQWRGTFRKTIKTKQSVHIETGIEHKTRKSYYCYVVFFIACVFIVFVF